MFAEPMLFGRYPHDLLPLLDPVIQAGDMATIRQPLDFYGVNYYNPIRIAAAAEDSPVPFEQLSIVGYPTTDFGRPVVPDSLREWLITLRARYRAALPPIIITESGCSYATGPTRRGRRPGADRLPGRHLRASRYRAAPGSASGLLHMIADGRFGGGLRSASAWSVDHETQARIGGR
jgi:beta-glucosidase